MCLIVDANLASLVFADPTRPDFQPIFDWIEEKEGVLIYGGKLAAELERVGRAARRIREWDRSGRAYRITEPEIGPELKSLKNQLRSDDPHVITLARESGAMVLCTNDQKLIDDFKNPDLVSSPRGSIYKNSGHAKQLKHHSSCKNARARTSR